MRIYNTISKKKETFLPIVKGQVGIYVCGVTIYDQLHLGHARTFVAFDVIVRWLKSTYGDEHVKFVRNITDIDDKIIERAKREYVTPGELTQQYIKLMNADFEALGLLKPSVEPKVSEHISDITLMIQALIDLGFAYQSGNGDILFDVRKYENYGSLSRQKVDMIGSVFNARELVKQTKKDHEHDFVLWKKSDEEDCSFPSSFGQGRPGWHIECSAMSKKHLGANFDIHGGGGDLIFPHHENEVAQSVAANESPYANTWMHTGMITVDGVKMSKSLGNFITIKTLLARYKPEVIRLFLLSSHYRSDVDFTDAAIEQAQKNFEKVYRALASLEESGSAIENSNIDLSFINSFEEAMNDDFNTPVALSVIYSAVKKLNQSDGEKSVLVRTIRQMGAHLGLFQQVPSEVFKLDMDNEIKELIEKRKKARQEKDWETADSIRQELLAKGVNINDNKI